MTDGDGPNIYRLNVSKTLNIQIVQVWAAHSISCRVITSDFSFGSCNRLQHCLMAS